jgi:hypothetical protein
MTLRAFFLKAKECSSQMLLARFSSAATLDALSITLHSEYSFNTRVKAVFAGSCVHVFDLLRVAENCLNNHPKAWSGCPLTAESAMASRSQTSLLASGEGVCHHYLEM